MKNRVLRTTSAGVRLVAAGARTAALGVRRTFGYSGPGNHREETSPLDRALSVADSIWPRLMGEPDRPTRSILFASPTRGCGTAVVATASAIALGRHLREPIGLVELDFEDLQLAQLLGAVPGVGVSDILLGQAELETTVLRTKNHPDLEAVGGGRQRALQPGDFAAPQFERLRSEMEQRCRTTIYIAPPLETCQNMRLVARRVDGVVCVVRAASTTKSEIDGALGMLDDSGARLVGSVMTGYDFDLPHSSAA
jgi:Mrp family chromosome partitioning ATPase